MNYLYVCLALGVIWAVTFSLRGVPFLFINKLEDNAQINFLRLALPGGVMLILVGYTCTDLPAPTLDFISLQLWGPYLLGVAITAGLHWRFHNPTLSIVAGIFTYGLSGYLLG